MKSATEIRMMGALEIAQAISDAKQEMFNLRLQWTSGQLEDYTRIRQLKKEIARMLTVQREQELAASLIQQEENHA